MPERRRPRGFVYTGLSIEDDLRSWLVALAADLAAILDSAPVPASTSDPAWSVPVPRQRLRDAAMIIRRASHLEKLAPIFPEQLSRRPPSSRRYWAVVDALDVGEHQRANVARRWKLKRSTLDKYVRELAPGMPYDFPLDERFRGEVAEIRKQILGRLNRTRK